MQHTTTLSLKKTARPDEAKPQRPEMALIGKSVRLQTRSKHVLIGKVISFDAGWIVIGGAEHHWLQDGTLSGPVTTGCYTLERNTLQFFCEVIE